MEMRKRLILVTATLLGVAIFSGAKAQETIAATSVTTSAAVSGETAAPEEEKTEPTFEITGAVDAYYFYSLNKMPFPTSFTNQHNSFSLGMANIMFSKTGKVGFMADIAFGPRAEAANGYLTEDGGITTLSIIKQLFVTYSPTEWLTLTAGNFGTFVGYEVIDAPVNMNYSTSYMFTNGPFYHTGLKANFKLSEHFGAMAGIFNDTDTKIDVVPGKHLGAQLSYTAGDLAVFLNYLEGKIQEETEESVEIFSHQVDLVATYALGKLGLGLNTSYRTLVPEEGDGTSWFGAAVYANYAVSEVFHPAIRVESISDMDGIITGINDNSILSLTLSGNLKVGPLTIIPEIRMDSAKEEGYFLDKDGKPDKSNLGGLLAVVYGF